MLQAGLTDIGKKFGSNIIFKGINLNIPAASRLVIQGANGSGKSTLLQVISGFLIPDKGTVTWKEGNTVIPAEKVHAHISVSAPYLEVPEEFTLSELLAFHSRFRPFQGDLSAEEALSISGLEHVHSRQVRNFSSGMKQRVRLTLALLSRSGMLLLDEPTANLDKKAIEWYAGLLEKYAGERTVVVCSNSQPADYPGFDNFFSLDIRG